MFMFITNSIPLPALLPPMSALSPPLPTIPPLEHLSPLLKLLPKLFELSAHLKPLTKPPLELPGLVLTNPLSCVAPSL